MGTGRRRLMEGSHNRLIDQTLAAILQQLFNESQSRQQLETEVTQLRAEIARLLQTAQAEEEATVIADPVYETHRNYAGADPSRP
jgi:hypothetical protein